MHPIDALALILIPPMDVTCECCCNFRTHTQICTHILMGGIKENRSARIGHQEMKQKLAVTLNVI